MAGAVALRLAAEGVVVGRGEGERRGEEGPLMTNGAIDAIDIGRSAIPPLPRPPVAMNPEPALADAECWIPDGLGWLGWLEMV